MFLILRGYFESNVFGWNFCVILNVPKSCLGQHSCWFRSIFNILNACVGVLNFVIYHSINCDCHRILGQNFLGRDVETYSTHINFDIGISTRKNTKETRSNSSFSFVFQSPQTEYNCTLIFSDNLYPSGQCWKKNSMNSGGPWNWTLIYYPFLSRNSKSLIDINRIF